MCGLVQDFFVENAGQKLNHEQLLIFVIDHCVDLDTEGKDVKTGYGLFILPDPDDIDIDRYITRENKEEEDMPRYQYLKDIPEGEFHDVIEFMIENKYIFGINAAENIEDTEVDLSLDMIRMFVINYRAGLYKARD